ncbi:4Fe-4S binding protein [Tranquillimonas alkanivorans]|uniref:4Fe-4S dicluster domain-containing protein n=1 Tax=Tranquillimonas alkanivorans TaxID=441119 RepID=A0A1I5KIL1_9RHOB|nr:4Fe-4S binding protein [Tranquillimonas alkanivorans]SFO84747.1 4Fe-4S dicluster domain-containing protein [Tranquillimonas alkanivorans]
MPKQLILCDCSGSQPIDADALGDATGLKCSRTHTALCTREMSSAAKAIQRGDAVIACQQERARFEEVAEELGLNPPEFVDIRDRAGWSDESADATPKMAALVAEAQLRRPETRTLDVVSEGLCLIVGASDVAVPAAEALADALSVTVCLTDAAEPPLDRRFDTVRGRVRRVSGAFGGFEVTLDALRQLEPGGRGDLSFGPPRDGAQSECDVLIDLTGDTPMVTAPHKREGYLRADPRDSNGVQAVLRDALQRVGTFEKPLYVRLTEPLCAHSRAEKTACTRCLDICPTGAITPAGEHVSIDPMICAGCGECSAVCPSGAIAYDAPPVDHLFRRIETLSRAFRAAGGTAPKLMVHDANHGDQMIRLAARYGRGLPADVIPLGLDTIAGFGHAEMLAALATGFTRVDVLLAPTTERDALDKETELAAAIAGEGRVRLLDPFDPDALCDQLYGAEAGAPVETPILPMGTRRQVARNAAQALAAGGEFSTKIREPIPLPEGAPYGAVLVDTDACTLCLSCVSLCPSGALGDNPDLPQLRFQEDACLQCGLCANICPEDAIALEPRLNLADEALTQKVLHEEEPFACIECGTLFGVKSTVERIMEKLAGKHAMFATGDAARMIQMCDDCRVRAQYHSQNNPFAGPERRKPRTTDDYYSDRRDH